MADALDLEDAIRGIAGQAGRPRLRRFVGTYAVRSPPESSPAASSRWTSRPKTPAVGRRRRGFPGSLRSHLNHRRCPSTGPEDGAGTSTSPKLPSPAKTRWGGWKNTRSPVTAEQIRAWCGRPDTDLVIKPGSSTWPETTSHGVDESLRKVPDRIPPEAQIAPCATTTVACSRGAPAPPANCDPTSIPAPPTTSSRRAAPVGRTCTWPRSHPLCRHPPPPQDLRRLVLPDPRTRLLPVDQPPPLPVPSATHTGTLDLTHQPQPRRRSTPPPHPATPAGESSTP